MFVFLFYGFLGLGFIGLVGFIGLMRLIGFMRFIGLGLGPKPSCKNYKPKKTQPYEPCTLSTHQP